MIRATPAIPISRCAWRRSKGSSRRRVWYKSPAYRSRVVLEPRRVLAEMGLELSEDSEVRVWDSSAEVRYLVLPSARPAPIR